MAMAEVIKTYEWRPGWTPPVPAEVVGPELERIKEANGGSITPEDVVEAARSKSSPIHDAFEWDDSVAAEEYRRNQAGIVIRAITVRVRMLPANEIKTTRAWVSVRHELVDDGRVGHNRVYVPVEQALVDDNLRHDALQQALKELDSFRRKYSDLEELATVFEAMDTAFQKVRP